MLELLIDHRGKTPRKLGGDWTLSGIPAISAMHISDGQLDLRRRERYVSDEMFRRWMTQPVKAGDVLLTSEAPVGQVARVPDDRPLVLSQRLFALRADKEVLDQRFLERWLSSPAAQDQITQRSSGTTVTGIRQAELRQMLIQLPSLVEQRRIVDIVEDHLLRLDAADAALATAGRRLARLRQARLDRAVATALAAKGTRLLRVGELARVGSGATPLRAKSAFYDGGSIPWITSGDLHEGLITTASRFITEEALRETAVKLWPAGTLLVAMYGEGKTRGTVGELGLAATTNQACAAIDLTSEFAHLRGWIRLFFEANYWQLRRQAAGGVQPNLSLGRIRDLAVPIPEPALARALTLSDRDLRDEESRVASTAAAARDRTTALRHSMLQAAFAGRLTLRTSVDELEGLASAR